MSNHSHIGQTILRMGLGTLFFAAGLMKVIFPGVTGIKGMLDGIGFPLAGFLAWVLILVELLGGAALIIGFKTKIATILLGIIMLSAIFSVQIKTFAQDFPAQMQFFKDLAILVGLASIYFSGHGVSIRMKRDKEDKVVEPEAVQT